MKLETIILDDGIEYAIIKELEINNTKYTLFANVNNSEEICYRKTIIKDNIEYYAGINDSNEFNLVANTFAKKIIKESR